MSLHTPRIRIAVMTFNRAMLLGRMLQSIQHQTYDEFEVRVFDNGSTDRTATILADIQEKDARISYDPWPTNRGHWANFTRARAWAEEGNYYALLHDDDELEPEWLEKIVSILDKNQDVGLVGTNARYLLDSNPVHNRATYSRRSGTRIFGSHEDFLRWFCLNGHLVFPSIVYRSSITRNIRLPSEARTGDIVWYTTVAAKTQVAVCFEQLFRYRNHSAQGTGCLSVDDLNALEEFFLPHVNNTSPSLNYYAKCWLAQHRIGILRLQTRGMPWWMRLSKIVTELRDGHLVVFSPIIRYYYGSLLKILLVK